MREQLLQSKSSKYEEIVSKVLVLEVAKLHSKEFSHCTTNSSSLYVNKIFKRKRQVVQNFNNRNKNGKLIISNWVLLAYVYDVVETIILLRIAAPVQN